MATTPAQFGAAVAAELPLFFRDNIDVFIRGEGPWLRDAEPLSATSRIGQAVGRAACRLYGQNPSFVEGVPQTRFEKACRPYLDSLSPSPGVGIRSPFSGGQCVGVVYRIEAEFWNPISNQWVWNTAGGTISSVPGAVAAIRVVEGASCNSGGFPGRFGSFSVDVGRPGNPSTVTTSPVCYPTQGAGGPIVRGLRAIRVSGGADICGNPPPVVVPPSPIPNPQPPPFRFNPTPNIDVDIDVDINPDGTIEFDFGVGPITVNPFGGGGDGSGGGGGAPPGDVGEPGQPEEPEDGEEVSGCAGAGLVLTGLRVDVLEVPSNATQYAPGVYRGACYIYMGTSAGLDHDPAGSMLRDGQFVNAEKDNLTCWAVRANLGWRLRVTPYYREVE